MNFQFDKKKLGLHVLMVIILAIVASIFCYPELGGKVMSQDDTINFKYLSKETVDFREANNEEPLWTSRVFSGMPTFFITYLVKTNIVSYIDIGIRSIISPTTAKIFVLFLGFYILLTSLGVSHWLALVGAIGYGLSSNLIVSILAGHNTKVLAIAYLAPAFAGAILAYTRKKYIGALLLLISLSLMVNSGHYQIVYYFILLSIVVGITNLVFAVKNGTLNSFLKTTGLLVITGIIAVMPNIGKVYNAYTHQAETIRGGKLKLNKESNEESETGLDKSYATRWSYGPLETMTVVIPSFKGGASNEALPKDGAVSKELEKYKLPKNQKDQILRYGPLYTGEQPFILGTVYFGAVFIFLLILALFSVSGPIRVIVIAGILIFLVISWGRHADIITGLFYDYLPGYNKFRTPSMAMAVLGILVPGFGVYGLSRIMDKDYSKELFIRNLKWTAYATGALLLMLLLFGLTSDWVGANDAQVQSRQPWSIPELYQALLADRKSNYLTDWVIAAFSIAAAAGSLWAWKNEKLKPTSAILILGLFIIPDMWRVGRNYINEDAFVSEKQFDNRLKPTTVDREILQDSDLNYRVIDLSVNPWTDGRTAYFHKSIGGHHAAKLQRYQDLIENALSPETQKMNGLLTQGPQGIMVAPNNAATIPVLNMLNMKYVIFKPEQSGGFATNPNACGNAWFVSDVEFKSTPQEEMNAIKSFNPNQTAIVSEAYAEVISSKNIGKSNANIRMMSFEPNRVVYQSSNPSEGLAVFSEVFYENGWKAYVDGKEQQIIRADYVLRALLLPSGDHEITMEFKPDSHELGSSISLAGSILMVLFAGGLLYMNRKSESETSTDSNA